MQKYVYNQGKIQKFISAAMGMQNTFTGFNFLLVISENSSMTVDR